MKSNRQLNITPVKQEDMNYSTKNDQNQGFTETFILLFKRYIKSPATYLAFALPIIVIFGLATIMPADKVLPAIMSVAIGTHAFITYGSTWFTLNKSSIYKNIYTSQYKKGTAYLAVWVLTFATTLVFAGLTILLTFSMSMIPNLFLTEWPWGMGQTPTGSIPWADGNWGFFMYAQVVSIIIFTSLAMFVATFLKSPKGYMSFAISYLILQVIFGSLVLFPFNSIREVDTLTGTLLPQLDNSDYFDPAFKATSGIFIYVRPSGNEFDFTNFVFWAEQAMPTYAINAWGYGTMLTFSSGISIPEAGIVNPIQEMLYFHTYTNEWLYLTIAPWGWTVLLTLGSIFRIRGKVGS